MSLSLALSDMQPQPPTGNKVCCNHLQVPAPWSCSNCKTYVCDTCVFKFQGTVRRLCPACLTQPKAEASTRRRNQAIGSLALSGFAAVFFVLATLSGADSPESPEATVLGALVLLAALAGTALGMGTLEYNLDNPPLLWFAAIAGGAFLAFFLLAAIAGIFLL